MLTTSAPKNAGQKPLTWKPSPSDVDSELVSQSIRPFTTRAKSPSVTMIEGKRQRPLVSGRRVALMNPNISATPRIGQPASLVGDAGHDARGDPQGRGIDEQPDDKGHDGSTVD